MERIVKSKRRNRKNNTVQIETSVEGFFVMLMILMIAVIVICITFSGWLFDVLVWGSGEYMGVKYTITNQVAGESNKEEDIANIQALMDKNEEYYLEDGEKSDVTYLANYNIEKDKFRFSNFGPYNSEGGACLGISVYEKLNYMGELDAVNEKIKEIYPEMKGFNGAKQDLSIFSYDKYDRSECMDAEILYRRSLGHYEDNLQDFFEENISEPTAEVLNTINYLFKESNDRDAYFRIRITPNRYASVKQAVLFDYLERKDKAVKEFEPTMITELIDYNEPVILGLGREQGGGHALMAYGYEYIDENTLKVHVSDSNLVLEREEEADYLGRKRVLVEQHNYDIRNNVYILFEKDNTNGGWNYIYNPRIVGEYPYEGEWNSFIPGIDLAIFQSHVQTVDKEPKER